MSYADWLSKLQIPWLVGRENGSREWAAHGRMLDDQAQLTNDAVQSAFPDKCAADAIPAIANEIQIPRGYLEDEASHRTRLREAWDPWKFAGQHLGLLLALYWDGYQDAVLVQQNGRYHTLTLPLPESPTEDPDSVLDRGPLAELAVPMTSSFNLARTPIPAGNPWWVYDDNIELCSRFSVLLPTQPTFWRHTAIVTFTDADSAEATWSNPFDDGDYIVQVGAVHSSAPVSVTADPGTRTRTGVTLVASDVFTGTVELIAYRVSEHPFCCPDATALANIRKTITLWRPGKATCEGIHALVLGRFRGWPVRTYGDGPSFQASDVVHFSP
jgi:hypothetical protein